MPRRRKVTPYTPEKTVISQPVLIPPHAVFSYQAAQQALGLGRNALRSEVRAGRLRMARRCNRCWFLGCWLLEWLESGVEKPGEQQEIHHDEE